MHCPYVSFTFLPSAASALCAPFIPLPTAFRTFGLRVHSPSCVPQSTKKVAKLTPSVQTIKYRFYYAYTALQRPTYILELLRTSNVCFFKIRRFNAFSSSFFGVWCVINDDLWYRYRNCTPHFCSVSMQIFVEVSFSCLGWWKFWVVKFLFSAHLAEPRQSRPRSYMEVRHEILPAPYLSVHGRLGWCRS